MKAPRRSATTTSRRKLRRRFLRAWPLWLVCLACAATGAHAQAPAPYPVLKLTLTNVGPQNVSQSLVKANIRVHEGDNYNRPSIDDDIRNLYSTGFFLNVRVTEERSVDGVNLTYILQTRPKLADIIFTGNKKYSTTRLQKKLTAKIGEPLDERKLFADVQTIRALYQKSGYPKTEVRYLPPAIDEDAGRAVVTIEVVEAPKVKITDVYFEGAYTYPQKKLRKTIKTRRRWMFSWITGTGYIKDDVLEDDKDRLAEFYQDAGYIDFELKEVQQNFNGPRKAELHFVVSEGKRYRVGQINFKGVTLFPTNDLLNRLKMESGFLFTPKGLHRDLEAIQDYYGARGYIGRGAADGDRLPIFARKNANIQTGTIDITYEIEEGEKSYVEKIEIKGNEHTKDKVIRRELAIAPGEVFDITKVKLSRKRLEGLNYFNDQGGVQMQSEPTEIRDRKNLVVSVAEKNTGTVTMGAGFSSVDSILGFVDVTQGNFDLFNPPYFRGGGQKARLRAQFGARRQDYLISFVEPWFLERKLAFSVDLFHREYGFQSLNDLYDERHTGGRLGLSRALGSDFLIGGVSYTVESVGIINVSSNASPIIAEEAGTRLVSKVGLSLAYDTRNNALYPEKGQRTELLAEMAGGPFGGDTDFYKVEAKTTWYFRGLSEGHVFQLAASTGIVESYGNGDRGRDRVPLFDRWFLGGVRSLRGYRYRQVGPRDANGEPIGGGTYWYGTAEYTIPIIDRLKFAIFYDVGMVYLDPYHWNLGNYNDNWGIGMRLNLPIGPLRLDYGIPITHDPSNGASGRFQFDVGYTREF